jgi:hypothetical protein
MSRLQARIAERDGRSMANMMQWLIRKHCEKESLGWPSEGLELPSAAVGAKASDAAARFSAAQSRAKVQPKKSEAKVRNA